MHKHHERGIALVLALFLMTAMSVLGASLMFLSQTETYASMNYRMMSQARYAAEAAVQKSSNFLLDPAQYTVPSAGSATDPLSAYNRNVSPVTWNNLPVILSASPAKAHNYPFAGARTAFVAASQGTLIAGKATLTYSSYATLVAMQAFESYGGTQAVVQTWEITADGGLQGLAKATVEVLAMIETPKVPASTYGAFGTDTTCGALTFGGNVTINSYDSTGMSGTTVPTMGNSGGHVGTNGNLTITGSVDVKGNLYTPRTGVGACTAGAVDGLTTGGSAQVEGTMVKLPAEIIYPAPTVPAPSVLPAVGLSNTTGACALLGLTIANCTTSGSDILIDGHGVTLSLPSVTMTSHTNIVLVAGSPAAQYNFNSISLGGGSEISIKAASATEGVLVNVVGKTAANVAIATPIDFTGGTFAGVNTCSTCTAVPGVSTYDASMLQFLYGGTGTIEMTGNNGAAATFYAPNAQLNMSGTADLYGSLLAKRVNESGNGNIHYDRRLQRDFYVQGHPMVGTFTWKRY